MGTDGEETGCFGKLYTCVHTHLCIASNRCVLHLHMYKWYVTGAII